MILTRGTHIYIYVQVVSPWGLEVDTEDNSHTGPGERGAFYAYGGIASCMSKPECAPPELPEQLGEVCCSFFLLASVTAAIFHRERTATATATASGGTGTGTGSGGGSGGGRLGEGQLCDCAMLRCATWMTNQTMVVGSRVPSGGELVSSCVQ
jgi:hypothetical protein